MALWDAIGEELSGRGTAGAVALSASSSRDLCSRLHEVFETLDYPVGYAFSVRAGLRDAGVERLGVGEFSMTRTELGTIVAKTAFPHRDAAGLTEATLAELVERGEVRLETGDDATTSGGDTQVFGGSPDPGDGTGDTRVFDAGDDGSDTANPNFCTNCGADLSDHEVVAFCPECGFEVE